jgi:N,N'-diacetyllegionaminate synthase
LSWLNQFFPDVKTVCVAEIGLNHGGDIDTAKQMIESAARAGADAVKFQAMNAESLYSIYSDSYSKKQPFKPDRKIINRLNSLSLSKDEYLELAEFSKQFNIYSFPTVFDVESVDRFMSIGTPFFKVASSDINYLPLLQKLAETRKPVILSTGMADKEDIVRALKIISKDLVVLLHCVSLYPAPFDLLQLAKIDILKQEYGVIVGFSDHSIDELGYLSAVCKGARMIERHFTDTHSRGAIDDAVSFDETEFKTMVKKIRQLEVALSQDLDSITANEKEIRRLSRRSVYAAKYIPSGTVLTSEMVCFKRPEEGIPVNKVEVVYGKTAKVDILKDSAITVDMLEGDGL